MKYESLPLAKINLKDERFRTSFHPDLGRLVISIKAVGLLSPPLIRQADKGFVLISGWKRVLACRRIGLSSINVLVTEEKDDLRIFLMALHENLATREINLVEKAEILRKLLGFGVEKKTLLKCYLPLLSFPATVAHIELILAISEAEPAVKKFVQKKDAPLPIVQSLLRFTPGERKLLLPLLRPLGQNKQKEVLEDLWETSRRDEVTLREILKDKEIRQVLDSPKLPPIQKAEKIRLSLKRKRYPQLSSWQDAFDLTLRKARWPKEIAIQPAPFFEDEAISASFRFKDIKEFRAWVKKLQEMAAKEEISGLFKR